MTEPPSLPTIPGLTWPVQRRQQRRTIIAKHSSGGDVRTALWQYPLWEFEIAFDGLSASATQHPGLGANSFQTLLGFYLTQGGPLSPFTFTDPAFNGAIGAPIGTGDGTTKQFRFSRIYGGAVEPVSWVTGTPTVYLDGVAQSGAAWTLAAPNVCGFVTAPTAGAVVTADCSYAFLCRFLDDNPDFEQMMSNIWELKSLKFRQVRTI